MGGMDFNGRNLHGLSHALADTPPPNIPLDLWRTLLGLPSRPSSATDIPAEPDSRCCFCRKRQHHADLERSEQNDVSAKTVKCKAALDVTLDEYIEALKAALIHLRPNENGGNVPNIWRFNKAEQFSWNEQYEKLLKPSNVDLY